ncbi:ZIP family metal transporter [Lachnospiraceae bacterium NSJ-143]|nr:ZIP family metal transporter [Lachnospiraceae bacterium NSJ-143]
MKTAVLWAAYGTGFTFLMTTLGAALVFFFKKTVNNTFERVFLGFAAGIMIAASVWSLLLPAIEQAGEYNIPAWVPAAIGLIIGALFLFIMDKIVSRIYAVYSNPNETNTRLKRTTMLITAITLHNIPEGMAVGLAFALAAESFGEIAAYSTALALAIGIGIQNFPEGAAVSLPLNQEGFSAFKSFILGMLSGIVEPIFGVLCVLAASNIKVLMPWLLSFAAGAMIYVVVEELVPEANADKDSHLGTLGIIAGFLIMMVLDVALG